MSRIVISATPYTVGRRATHSLVLPFPGVSANHARFHEQAGELLVEDLSSTNGTWVNGVRVRQSTQLLDGDVVQFGEVAFRVSHGNTTASDGARTEDLADSTRSGLERAARIDSVVRRRRVRALFQPVIRLADGVVVAYECLVRGDDPELPAEPERLFQLAALRGLEAELSRVCRHIACEEAQRLCLRLESSGRPTPSFHSRLHPREPEENGFVTSLREIRDSFQDVHLILEIHEKSLGRRQQTTELLTKLRELGYGVGFEDFGSGLSRLNELANCPPDLLKFDPSLIALASANAPRIRQLLESLLQMAREIGCMTCACGVDTSAQLSLCSDLGFDLAQGNALGRPAPLEQETAREPWAP